MSRLVISALIGLAAVAACTKEKIPQLLLIVREQVRPDSAETYATNESEIVRTCARLTCPHPYLALTPVSGRTDVWWLSSFSSREDKERIDRVWASSGNLMAELRPLAKRKEGLRQALTTTLTTHRPDLSAAAAWRVDGARFFVVTVGHGDRQPEGAVFESPDGERFVITPATTRATADHFAAGAGANSLVLAVQPQWSVPSDDWVAADPDFWKQNPAARSRPRSRRLR
jgi:hypothetical protein